MNPRDLNPRDLNPPGSTSFGNSQGALAALPEIPRDADGPIFREPWEAQAFAMTVRLHEQGVFTWPEWAAALAAEIKAAQARGDPDTGETYYHHWLAALEKLAAAKALVQAEELETRRDQWDRAARATPHGQPIELANDPGGNDGHGDRKQTTTVLPGAEK